MNFHPCKGCLNKIILVIKVDFACVHYVHAILIKMATGLIAHNGSYDGSDSLTANGSVTYMLFNTLQEAFDESPITIPSSAKRVIFINHNEATSGTISRQICIPLSLGRNQKFAIEYLDPHNADSYRYGMVEWKNNTLSFTSERSATNVQCTILVLQ